MVDGPTGTVVETSAPFDELDVELVLDACTSWFQTGQESWHPSAAGHQVDQCPAGAWSRGGAQVTCVRRPDGSLSLQ